MNSLVRTVLLCSLLVFISGIGSAKNSPRLSSEILRLAWGASSEGDLTALGNLVDEMFQDYEQEANSQADQLTNFPPREQIKDYAIMNDVAVCLFVKAEAYMHQGKNDEAVALYKRIIQQYPWAQGWDASRGAYWSVREKSQVGIDRISGAAIGPETDVKEAPKTKPTLAFPGIPVVDYAKYGQFLNEGTKDYHYQVTDPKGLAAAVGEGIYPNLTDIYKDPQYKKVLKEGRLNGSIWDFVNTQDLQAAFYKWATAADESQGTKLFNMGVIFEKAKMYFQAIKCYQAVTVYFPGTIAWTYWHTPWYPGQAAVAKIQHIVRMHPELKLSYSGAKIRILNSFDNDASNDIIISKPGILTQRTNQQSQQKSEYMRKIALGKPVKSLGQGKVRFVKYENGHWQLLVHEAPFLIKGITYTPTKIGQSPDNNSLTNWMTDDFNHNGIIDGPYEAWLDKNHNNKQDFDEPTVGDFALMKDMGVNTLRIYQHPQRPVDKEFLRKMYNEYGFMVLMGNLVGKYAVGSGATWAEGTDYENPEHEQKMLDNVREMVEDMKDEPYILMWLLGNENNYGVASNADKKPEAYFKFINKVAQMIKSIDPNHPVAVCNGDTLFLDKFAQFAPDVDAYAANVYRGDYGFGSFWQQVQEAADKPAFISEYGAPAFAPPMTSQEAQAAQAAYHKGNWLDIKGNSAGYADGVGNAVGGVAFEWLDEWWKNYEPAIHDTKADVVGPFSGGYYYEEWFGLIGQGDGKNSPYLREPREVYYTYRDLWNS